MKRVIIMASFLCTLIFSIEAQAEFKVPTAKESEQWKVQLLEPTNDKDEKDKFEVYNLLVTNKGKKVYNVYVGAFRNEPSTKKMYGLAPQMENKLMETGQTFSFTNFPVKTGTEELEFVITWEDEPITLKNGEKASGRKYKETIVFTP